MTPTTQTKPLTRRLEELALTHIGAVGSRSTSLVRLARDANTELSEVSRHYHDVGALFDRALDWALGSLHEDLASLSETLDSPMACLLSMLHRITAGDQWEQAALLALIREHVAGDELSPRALWHVRGIAAPLLAVIEEGQGRGYINPLPPRFILTSIVGTVVAPRLAPGMAGQNSADAHFAGSLELLLSGILKR